MASPALLFGGLLAVAAAALYAAAGALLHRRPVSPPARAARDLFSTWWAALSAVNLSAGGSMLLYWAGVTHVALHATLLYVRVPLLAVGLWGLLYYLVYLYTGRERSRTILGVFYGGLALLLFAFYSTAEPIAVTERSGDLVFRWAQPPNPIAGLVALVGIVLPILGAALAYASLAFRTRAPLQRYRIALVSTSFLLWFGLFFAAGIAGADAPRGLTLALRGAGLAVPLLVLVAYRPPRFLPARWREERVE